VVDHRNPSAGGSRTAAEEMRQKPGGEAGESNLPPGEVIAYDEQGKPAIVRQVNAETGIARTIVRGQEGSQRVFGENTIAALTNSGVEEAAKWCGSLSKLELRGLVHEVGQRLLEASRAYHSKVEQLDRLDEIFNYCFFGLNADTDDKALDNAYRRMAKKMHPDKNGGTEAAKLKFQQMKERYESLKKKRGGDVHGDESVPRNAGDGSIGHREDSKGQAVEGEDCRADPGPSDHAEHPSENVGSETQQDADTSQQQSK